MALSRGVTSKLETVQSYASAASDHYPISFIFSFHTEKTIRPRRITKTILQSLTLKETASLYYTAALNDVDVELEASANEVVELSHQKFHKAYDNMTIEIKAPWLTRANKRRSHSPPHWNKKFLEILARKKLLYQQMRWKQNRPNARAYKHSCRGTQKLERKLIRE